MNLYLISRDYEENESKYDTYSNAVVCARSRRDAATIHPSGDQSRWDEVWRTGEGSWTESPEDVVVTYLGKASKRIKRGVICASYHAG